MQMIIFDKEERLNVSAQLQSLTMTTTQLRTLLILDRPAAFF